MAKITVFYRQFCLFFCSLLFSITTSGCYHARQAGSQTLSESIFIKDNIIFNVEAGGTCRQVDTTQGPRFKDCVALPDQLIFKPSQISATNDSHLKEFKILHQAHVTFNCEVISGRASIKYAVGELNSDNIGTLAASLPSEFNQLFALNYGPATLYLRPSLPATNIYRPGCKLIVLENYILPDFHGISAYAKSERRLSDVLARILDSITPGASAQEIIGSLTEGSDTLTVLLDIISDPMTLRQIQDSILRLDTTKNNLQTACDPEHVQEPCASATSSTRAAIELVLVETRKNLTHIQDFLNLESIRLAELNKDYKDRIDAILADLKSVPRHMENYHD